jgi:hypothetical protein
MLVHLKKSPALASEMPSSEFVSSVEEAQFLVRQCSEPSPSRDSVKAAIRRASRRLELPFTRLRDIWYGDARRIDAKEMDKLRQVAEEAEFTQAIAAVQTLLNKVQKSRLPESVDVIKNLTAALDALSRGHGLKDTSHD